jgi:nitrite reductase/ring-hydroxylating ferredoxin subunit
MADQKRLSDLSERLSDLSERLSGLSERLTEVRKRGPEVSVHLSRGNAGPGEASEGPAASGARVICAGGDLVEGGDGVRFEIECNGEAAPAFAIRRGGSVYGYLNRCAHISMELDWKPGKFFDADGEYLICSTHGALYAPESGACRGGPCRGAALLRLNVFEADGKVYVRRD